MATKRWSRKINQPGKPTISSRSFNCLMNIPNASSSRQTMLAPGRCRPSECHSGAMQLSSWVKITMMRKAIRGHLEHNAALERLLSHIKNNVGFVFTLADIRDRLTNNKVKTPALVGAVSPCDVLIPA
eukprot:XP_014772826.1 PREDICTED: 60S acidic ribosomal protein P0-like [Octopus bimaculoides]